jgi:4-hydroxythreonine-4-phosphate dehydrogenase
VPADAGGGAVSRQPWDLEIAGKGMANNESFKEAVYLAIDVFHRRNDYHELTKNRLKTKQKQL